MALIIGADLIKSHINIITIIIRLEIDSYLHVDSTIDVNNSGYQLMSGDL